MITKSLTIKYAIVSCNTQTEYKKNKQNILKGYWLVWVKPPKHDRLGNPTTAHSVH